MENEYFIIYDTANGAERSRGFGPAGVAAMQRPASGCATLALPASAMAGDLADHVPVIRQALWQRAKLLREGLLEGAAPTGYGLMDCGAASRINLIGAAVMAQISPANFSIGWTTANNDVVTLDAAAMIAVASEVYGYVSAVHAAAAVLRARLEAAGSVADLLGIDIEAGFIAGKKA